MKSARVNGIIIDPENIDPEVMFGMARYKSLSENGKRFVNSSEKYSVDDKGFIINQNGITVPPEIIESELNGLIPPREFCIYGLEAIEKTATPANKNSNRVYVPKNWKRVMVVRLE